MSLLTEIQETMMPTKKNTGRLFLSLGQKFTGKTFMMLRWLEYCFKHKVFDVYCLVLPSYAIEASDSYSFIDEKNPDILIFESYSQTIPEKIMRYQKKLIGQKKNKKKICFVVDDSSAEQIDSFHLDNSLKRLITSIRHYNTHCWIISHATAGCLSTFLRGQIDVLILYNVTNLNLLEGLYDEFLSLNQEFRKSETARKNKADFINQFLEFNEDEHRAIFINLRNRKVYWDLFETIPLLK